MVEKTKGNIIDINGDINAMNSQRLIKAKYDSTLSKTRLKICVKLENLIDIKEMFIICTYLKTISEN